MGQIACVGPRSLSSHGINRYRFLRGVLGTNFEWRPHLYPYQKRWVYRREIMYDNPRSSSRSTAHARQASRRIWTPEYFIYPARVLEFSLPDGMLN